MKFNSNKDKGNAGLAMAIAYFGSNGFTVSVPLNDTQDYDLVVEIEGKLHKVQVKSTANKENKNSYRVNLRSMGGTKGIEYKKVIDTDIDLLFVLCKDKTMYLIPFDHITQRSTISLPGDNNKLDYSKFIVAM